MSEANDDEMRDDYDFSRGIQSKYRRLIAQLYTVESTFPSKVSEGIRLIGEV